MKPVVALAALIHVALPFILAIAGYPLVSSVQPGTARFVRAVATVVPPVPPCAIATVPVTFEAVPLILPAAVIKPAPLVNWFVLVGICDVNANVPVEPAAGKFIVALVFVPLL